jgi:hypothetical protein
LCDDFRNKVLKANINYIQLQDQATEEYKENMDVVHVIVEAFLSKVMMQITMPHQYLPV